MTKKKSSEGRLQKLCKSRGAITVFQKKIKSLLDGDTKDRDYFQMLLEFLILVARFQDKKMKELIEIKEGLKIENPDLFKKFGKFYATVKICGRDKPGKGQEKADKHKSFVSNQARSKSLRNPIYYSPTNLNVYLSSEFYRGALSLQQVKIFKTKKDLGKYHDKMMEDITQETKKFVKNNGKILCDPIF